MGSLSSVWGNISSLEEKRSYQGCGEEYKVEKMTMGRNIPLILRLLEEHQVGKRGRATENLAKKIKI